MFQGTVRMKRLLLLQLLWLQLLWRLLPPLPMDKALLLPDLFRRLLRRLLQLLIYMVYPLAGR
jgi:hypothetical protein